MATQSQPQARAVPEVYEPLLADPKIATRFWAKVEKTETCWLWRGRQSNRGYGKFDSGGHTAQSHTWLAHRYAYESLVEPIPAGLTLDHLCRVHNCVRPTHLEPVTNRINILRGEGFAAQQAAVRDCKHGHPFDLFNTYRWRGERHCRTCVNQRKRDARRKKWAEDAVKVLEAKTP